MTDTAAGDLGVMFPAAREFTVAGRAVSIPVASIRTRALALQAALALREKSDPALPDELVLIDEHPDESTAVLELATGLDRAWLAGLSAVDKYELALAWVEVNGNFLLRELALRGRALRQMGAMFGDGPTSSLTSATPDSKIPERSPPKPRPGTSMRSIAQRAVRGANA